MLRYIYSTLTIRHLCRISLTNRRFWMWQQKTLLFALNLTCSSFHQWFAADFVTCKLKHQQKDCLFGAKVENPQLHWLRSLIFTTYLRNVRAYSLVKKKKKKKKKDSKICIIGLIFRHSSNHCVKSNNFWRVLSR